MGILEVLFGRKKPEFSDRIWLTGPGKIRDLLNHVRNDQVRGINSLVVTHFPDTQKSLLESMKENGLACNIIDSSPQFQSELPELVRQKGRIVMLASEAIPAFLARAVGAQPKNATFSPLAVRLAEHYPLLERDQRVLDLDKVLPMQIEFTCFTSLDETWLASFGADRIKAMLSRLNLKEEEVLEHPMLNSAIKSAQKRLSGQIVREKICNSCQEWVQKNLSGHT